MLDDVALQENVQHVMKTAEQSLGVAWKWKSGSCLGKNRSTIYHWWPTLWTLYVKHTEVILG